MSEEKARKAIEGFIRLAALDGFGLRLKPENMHKHFLDEIVKTRTDQLLRAKIEPECLCPLDEGGNMIVSPVCPIHEYDYSASSGAEK